MNTIFSDPQVSPPSPIFRPLSFLSLLFSLSLFLILPLFLSFPLSLSLSGSVVTHKTYIRFKTSGKNICATIREREKFKEERKWKEGARYLSAEPKVFFVTETSFSFPSLKISGRTVDYTFCPLSFYSFLFFVCVSLSLLFLSILFLCQFLFFSFSPVEKNRKSSSSLEFFYEKLSLDERKKRKKEKSLKERKNEVKKEGGVSNQTCKESSPFQIGSYDYITDSSHSTSFFSTSFFPCLDYSWERNWKRKEKKEREKEREAN